MSLHPAAYVKFCREMEDRARSAARRQTDPAAQRLYSNLSTCWKAVAEGLGERLAGNAEPERAESI